MDLLIFEPACAARSLQAWLAVELAGAPCELRPARGSGTARGPGRGDDLPARHGPVLRFDDGAEVWESLSLIEELGARFSPDRLWPAEPAARAAARALAGEMQAGFVALRRACPMTLERRFAGYQPSVEVLEDVARIEALWTWATARFGGDGPWLFGPTPCAADAMFAPVVACFVTYGLGETETTARLQEALYAWGPFRRWRAMDVAEKRRGEDCEMDLPEARRFGPAPRPARVARPGAKATNAVCPCSARPVAADALAEIEGRVIGFCSQVCRDRAMADADAWPRLAALLA